MDEDKNGMISKSNFKHSLSSQPNMTEDMLSTVFNNCDTKQDGFIDFEEFLTAATCQKHLCTDDNLKAIFKIIDHNNYGWIDVDELKFILPNYNTNLSKQTNNMCHTSIPQIQSTDGSSLDMLKGFISDQNSRWLEIIDQISHDQNIQIHSVSELKQHLINN